MSDDGPADAEGPASPAGRSPLLVLVALVAVAVLVVAFARPAQDGTTGGTAAPPPAADALLLEPVGEPSSTLLGYNSEGVTTGATPYDGPLVTQALADLAPQVVRWPGGILGSYWDWRAGTVVPPSDANPPAWVERAAQRLEALPDGQTVEAIAAARSVASRPFDVMVVLNMLTSVDGDRLRFRDGVLDDGLDEQLALLAALEEAGVPITHVELGNEPWAGGPGEGESDYEEVYGGPAEGPLLYAEVSQVWARAVVDAFPDARVGVAAAPRTTPFPRPEGWNGPLLDAVADEPAITAATFHVYAPAGLPPEGTPAGDDALTLAAAADQRLQVFAQAEAGDVAARAPRLDLWVTEAGLFDESGARTHGTWASGLVDAQLALGLADRGASVVVDHSLLGDGIFGAVFFGEDGLDFGGRFAGAAVPVPTAAGGLSAKGRALSLVTAVRAGRPEVQQLRLAPPVDTRGAPLLEVPTLADGRPVLRAELACPAGLGGSEGSRGSRGSGGSGGSGAPAAGACAVVLLNLGEEPLRVALPAGLAGDGQTPPAVRGVSADPAAYVTGTADDPLLPVAPADADGTVVVPPAAVVAVGAQPTPS